MTGLEGSGEAESKRESSFWDFLGGGRSQENVGMLVSRVLSFGDEQALLESLQGDGVHPTEIDELRRILGGRQKCWEKEELYNSRRQAAERLITVRGKMAWKQGERDPEDTETRRDSLRAGFVGSPRREKRTYPETESGDE